MNFRSPLFNRLLLHFTRREFAPVTNLIVWSAVAVYLGELYYLFVLHSLYLQNLLVCSDLTFETRNYWQFLTYAWVHSPSIPMGENTYLNFPLHLLVNMMMINSLGKGIEPEIGSFRFILLYLGSVIAAVAAFFLFNDNPYEAVMGASGAAFGLITALAVLFPNESLQVLIFFVIPAKMKVKTLALIACGFELLCICFHWLTFVSHSAHLGGAFFGFLFTLLITRGKKRLPLEYSSFEE